jgi:exocyst complex component 4
MTHSFIMSGVGHLMDAVLVTNASRIGVMNEHGCGRMQLNILVLQQNLKNIEPRALLRRSSRFYDFFGEGPEAIIKKAAESDGGKNLEFSYDELKVLVELCYSEAKQSDRREIAVQANRSLSDHLLQLSEHLW